MRVFNRKRSSFTSKLASWILYFGVYFFFIDHINQINFLFLGLFRLRPKKSEKDLFSFHLLRLALNSDSCSCI